MATIVNRNLNLPNESFDGIITDISDSGICLLTTNSLSKGQKISMNIGTSASSRTAIVRWSERFDSLYYAVGLEFL